MIVVSKIEKTCRMCPSQWEGVTEDGRQLYARYRYGHLYVNISKTPTEDTIAPISDGITVFTYDSDDEWDGVMSSEEVATLTSDVITYPEDFV